MIDEKFDVSSNGEEICDDAYEFMSYCCLCFCPVSMMMIGFFSIFFFHGYNNKKIYIDKHTVDRKALLMKAASTIHTMHDVTDPYRLSCSKNIPPWHRCAVAKRFVNRAIVAT